MKFFLQKNSRTPHFTLHFYQINHFECVTFAWFTSKDEVTNRLSASGDYDVSIVESFAPPAKWVPGQAVNKDVYAVNTGNVEAYVKESVTSVMTIVTEEATTDLTKPDADCIELSAGERYVVEAGAYLAYAPLASEYTYDTGDDAGKVKSGLKVIAMNPDFKNDNGYTSADPVTDFKPDAEGLYVFRRSIGVDSKTQLENYTYDAYYYVPGADKTTVSKQVVGTDADGDNKGKYKWVSDTDATDFVWTTDQTKPDGYSAVTENADVAGVAGKFYKVSNLAVTPEKATFAGDEDQRDGMVSATTAPTYGFYKDVTKTVVPKLTYDKANNRLVASYDTGMAIDKDKLVDLAKKYEDAAIAFEKALEDYAAAIDDQQNDDGNGNNEATDTALNNATNALKEKLADLLAAQKAEADAKAAFDKAEAEAKALEIAMQNAQTEMGDAATNLGDDHDMYVPADGDTPAVDDTLWGRYNYADKLLGKSTDSGSEDPQTAWGKENAAKAILGNKGDATTATTKWGLYNKAEAELKAAEPEAKNAFLDLVAANQGMTGDDKRDLAEAYLDSLTYDEITRLTIVNQGDPAYVYYEKLVAEKYAKDELDKAQAAYDTAVQERVAAQNALATALKNRQDAEAALGDTNNLATADANTAAGRFYAAQQAYYAKMEECFGYANGGDGTEDATKLDTYDRANLTNATEDHYVKGNGSLYGKYKAAQANTADKQDEVDAAQDAYNTALAASNVAAANVKAAADNVAKTKQAKENAWNAYDAAQKADDGKLKININLAEVVTEGGVADKWQLLPESLEDVYKNDINASGVNTITTATDGETDTASFYYTSILGGGETSAKLIDSVELDSSVTKEMFKYFDFDLNVTLNSAQVTFDNDGNYSTDAVIAENGFNKYAFLKDNTSADTAITWSETATATPTKYKATAKTTTTGDSGYGDTTNVTIVKLADPVNVDGTYYLYEATSGATKYYGNSLNKDTVYIASNVTNGTGTAIADSKLKLGADATVDNT